MNSIQNVQTEKVLARAMRVPAGTWWAHEVFPDWDPNTQGWWPVEVLPEDGPDGWQECRFLPTRTNTDPY